MAKVRIPTPLRSFTKGQDEVIIGGKTIGEVLKNLELEFKGIGEKILDDQGNVRRFINVFLGENDVRHLQGVKTEVKENDVLSIFPAIAGGQQDCEMRIADCEFRVFQFEIRNSKFAI